MVSAMRLVAIAVVLLSSAVLAGAPFELDGSRLKLPSPIVFVTGKADLAPESDAALAHVRAYLAEKTSISTLRIEVHTDSQGADAANQKLSQARALAVARKLVSLGVDCKRLMPVGFGETKPVAPNDTPEGRAQNRRTEFVNAGLRGIAIGGMPLDGGGVTAGDPCLPSP